MNITQEMESAGIRIRLDGRLDVSSYFDFKEVTEEVLSKEPGHVILDCEKLSMISSVGIREFILLQQKITEKKGTLELKGLNDKMMDIFKTAGLEDTFKFTQ